MINGEAILGAVLSLRDATEQSFKRLEAGMAAMTGRISALETRFDRFEVKVLQRFDSLDACLTTVEQR
jgi:hypothetical protein